MRTWVGCIRIDGLYVTVEREHGAVSPFAIANGKSIVDACPKARAAGVVPGALVASARRLCAGLRILAFEPRRYRAAAGRWMRPCLDHSPWLEPLAPHEAFLDLTGHPDPNAAIRDLHRLSQGYGLSARAAVASNKLVARAATIVPDTLRDPVTLVPPGAERAFLAPHPVRALWPLGEKLLARLERLEYENVAEIAASSLTDLRSQLGKEAAMVQTLAQGRYPDPVRALYPEATIRRRERWLEPIELEEMLWKRVGEMAKDAAEALSGRCCRVFSLTLEMEDNTRRETRETRRLMDRAKLPETALRLLERLAPDGPVAGVALVAGALQDPPPLDGDLFSLDKIRRRRALDDATLCLEERFGKRILFPCSDVPVPWREQAWQAFWGRLGAGVV
ncbi:MAG TPA: hypothetical protein VGM37_09050 [Armatimonadota bacterium]|jgi:nucleotidyltransferase/DNA polymerase involved in DNA repair